MSGAAGGGNWIAPYSSPVAAEVPDVTKVECCASFGSKREPRLHEARPVVQVREHVTVCVTSGCHSSRAPERGIVLHQCEQFAAQQPVAERNSAGRSVDRLPVGAETTVKILAERVPVAREPREAVVEIHHPGDFYAAFVEVGEQPIGTQQRAGERTFHAHAEHAVPVVAPAEHFDLVAPSGRAICAEGIDRTSRDHRLHVSPEHADRLPVAAAFGDAIDFTRSSPACNRDRPSSARTARTDRAAGRRCQLPQLIACRPTVMPQRSARYSTARRSNRGSSRAARPLGVSTSGPCNAGGHCAASDPASLADRLTNAN